MTTSDKVIRLAVYPGEEPVRLSCGDVVFEIGHTALRSVLGAIEIETVSEVSEFHQRRMVRALQLLSTIALSKSRAPSDAERTECRERHQTDGLGCITDEF